MTRRELREQIFKLLFGVEFHDRQELPEQIAVYEETDCLLYTSPSPRDKRQSRMPSSA